MSPRAGGPRRRGGRPLPSQSRRTQSGRTQSGRTQSGRDPSRTGRSRRSAAPSPHRSGARPAPTRGRTAARSRKRIALGDPGRRLYAAFWAVSLVCALLVARLLQVQAFEASSYASVAQNERLRTVDVPATRGMITDRNGEVLARSVETRTVTADPTLIADPRQYAHLLAPQLRVDEDELARKLGDRPRRYVILAHDVDPERWREIRETIDPGTGRRLVGIFAEVSSTRVYPADELAANILGFVNREGNAGGGIELEFDTLLAGQDGSQTYERSSSGAKIATAGIRTREPVPGRDLQLTIDRDIQFAAQRTIAAKVREARAESGTVVVQDVRTGEILAMATAPSFDPNDPGSARDADRGNRALSEIYEPGSITKALTVAALIEEGVVTPRSQFTVPSRLYRAGHVVNDHTPHGIERWTMAGILAKSSNIGTVLASERVSRKTLYRYLKEFGIAEPTGLGFPGESRGLLPRLKDWTGTTAYTVTFGQGFALNTVQAASIYQTIANDGVRIEPRLVKSWTGENGLVHMPEPAASSRVVGPSTARTVAKMLEQVTAPGGTAPHVQVPGYRVAGKTGTAQYADPTCGCYRGYTASFAGFAPVDNPRVVVSVTLQRPVRGHYGGLLGGPVFAEVLDFALRSTGVSPTGTKPARLELTW